MGSSEVIAHTMAERVIAQAQSGKSKDELTKEMKESKKALQIAQKAFYDKDPEAIALI